MKTMNRLRVLATLVALGAGGTYALAQSNAPAKPAQQKPAAAPAPAQAGATCDCVACEAHGGKDGMGGGMKGGMGDCPMMQEGGCPG